PPIADALSVARAEIAAHAGALGSRAAALDAEAIADEQRFAARLPGLAEVELLNLGMRAGSSIDVVERLIPDPIDSAAPRAEVKGSRDILEHMRAVLAAAATAMKTAADWDAQIDALDQRFRAASARVDARIQRRQATLDLLETLCRLDREHDAAHEV